MLYIVASYHSIKFQEKVMDQTWENGKKTLVFGPIVAPLAKIWTLFFFSFGFYLS